MKNIRIVFPVIAAATVAATAAAGLYANATGAVVVAAAGVLASLMVLGWTLVKTLQTVSQRLSGLIKQTARVSVSLEKSAADLNELRRAAPAGSSQMTGAMQRALEDLTLASRSLTVPQAHFDQLLRSVSANTVRTEAALNDTLDEVRTVVNDASLNVAHTSSSYSKSTL